LVDDFKDIASQSTVIFETLYTATVTLTYITSHLICAGSRENDVMLSDWFLCSTGVGSQLPQTQCPQSFPSIV